MHVPFLNTAGVCVTGHPIFNHCRNMRHPIFNHYRSMHAPFLTTAGVCVTPGRAVHGFEVRPVSGYCVSGIHRSHLKGLYNPV